MAKKYLEQNVYEATIDRIRYLFAEFDNVLVAFSGGKDSGVCLNICYDYAKENNMLDKLGMYHLDYEAQYQMTTDYVKKCFCEDFKEIKKYWLCLPISAQCSVNMEGGHWITWDKEKQSLWVRKMPTNEYIVNEDNAPFQVIKGETDYDLQDRFNQWYSSQFGKTAVVIGIRTAESLNRFRAIKSNKKVNTYKGLNYVISQDDKTCKAYPIYDWETEDIWIYNAKFYKDYNKLYDLYYQAGLSIDEMRVASPFNDCATSTLKLYKVIDPNTWGRMVSRVNGVNFAGLYGGTTAMGWKSITKPNHFTWKEYCYFLLDTLDEKTKQHYLEKLNTSIEFWKNKGGALSEETISELKEGKIGEPNNYSEKRTITFETYPDELDVTNFKEVPSYKRMCVCILKNDYYCKYMGFAPTKEEANRRKRAMEKYAKL